MTAHSGQDAERQLVPRWRSFAETVRFGDLEALSTRIAFDDDEVERALALLAANPNSYERAEVLSTLVARGDAVRARSVSGKFDKEIPSTLREFIARLSDENHTDGFTNNDLDFDSSSWAMKLGSGARRRLKTRSNNAVAWVDLALAHTIQGMTERAQREIAHALQLAPDNRFVLRSAARFFVHLDRPELANHVLRSSRRVEQDPWLMAAELSTAQLAYGRVKNATRARAMIEHSGFSPRALSELTSELATSEMQSGRDRRARTLFRQSFVDPTENAVAQAVSWSDRSNVELAPELLRKDYVFEGRALENARSGHWAAATREAASWHRDQPFSVEPFRLASYAASLGSGEFLQAAEIAKAGLRLHEGDRALRNNAAYSLANVGRTQEARTFALAPDRAEAVEDCIEWATLGLIDFREGEFSAGAAKYHLAIVGLNKIGRKDLAAMAAAHWALEENHAALPTAAAAIQRALKLLPDAPRAERETLKERIERPGVS